MTGPERVLRDSGGHTEKRWVTETPVAIGNETLLIEITLTARDDMLFRTLLAVPIVNVAGVGLLRSNHGPVVMEVNSSSDFEGIEAATTKDVAGMIIEFIEKNARQGKTRTRGRR